MKITQVMLARGFGGGERHFVDLSLALARRGYQVQAVCHGRFQRRELLEAEPGVTVSPVSPRGWWDPFAQRRINQAVAAFAPDLVHGHMVRASYMGGRAARGCGAAMVTTMHNYATLSYYRRVDHFIATTQALGEYLRGRGIDAAAVSVLPYFTLVEPRQAVTEPRDPQVVVFVAVGRFVHKKGFDVLLSAFRRLLDSGVPARLLLGGDGPQRGTLEKQARQLGLERAVKLTGWVDEVPTLFDRGDVFVLPSRDEPFGIVTLEAMACGLPVVTTRTHGPSEVLDESTAWFAGIDEVDTLTEAMRQAAADPEGRAERARTASRVFHEQYHPDVVVDRITALYTQVVDRRTDAAGTEA